MNDPAIEPTSSDLSLNGLEQIFVQPNTANIHEHQTNIHEHRQNISNIDEYSDAVSGEAVEIVTMAEASRRLKMPYPTLRRQVLNGKIPSTPGPDGKPLVKLVATEHSSPRDEHSPMDDEHSSNIQGQRREQSEYSMTIQRLFDLLEIEREQIQALSAKLEAASHRNGYLEAQLAEKDVQIKLLTDSQRKQSFWRRFCSWFTR